MAMRLASPWWLSGLLLLGLVSIFAGERAFAHLGMATQITLLGCLLVAGATGLRGWVILKSGGRQRRIELVAMLCNLGVLLALALYYTSTKSGMALFGVEEEAAQARFHTAMTVIWVIVLLVSLLPLIMVEVSLGISRREGFRRADEQDASVDVFQVRELANSGLSIALATAFLMVTCNIADQRNLRKDVSYFKTSMPGEATTRMVKTIAEPLQVMIFFPELNETAREVEAYFEELAELTNNVELSRKDRLVDLALAKEHKIKKDGSILLMVGKKAKAFTINTDYRKARRNDLREFDARVQEGLMEVIREERVAYLSIGHEEFNDGEGARTKEFESLLEKLNYRIKPFQGYGRPIPEDCSLLFVLAPKTQLSEEELRAIDEYLARGGSAIMAFDPDAEFALGLLEERMGVHYNPAVVLDDKDYMRRTGRPTDLAFVLTNRFSSHEALTTLSNLAANQAIVFPKTGSFDKIPKKRGQASTLGVITTMSSGFRDTPDEEGKLNFKFDRDVDKRKHLDLVMVVEDESAVAEGAQAGQQEGMRVMLFGDRDVFSDGVLKKIPIARDLLKDAIKWVGGEENFTGKTNDEKDKRIEHTKSQDAAWFYASIVGAPLLVLGLGLVLVSLRRRRSKPARSKPAHSTSTDTESSDSESSEGGEA